MSTTLASIIDRKHLSAIADAARTVLQSASAFLDAARFGKGNPETDVIYEEWEDDLAALRRCIADAGCFNLRRQFFKSREDTRAYACLRTVAKDVGEYPQAPHTAGALPPLPTEESVAHLAAFVAAVEKVQGSATPVTLGEQEAVVLKVLGKHHPCRLTAAQIANEMVSSEESIGDYLLKLQRHEPPLVTTRLKKSGRTLTDDGLRVVAGLSDATGARLFRKPR